MKRITYLLTWLMGMVLMASCDQTSMNESLVSVPVIESFSPEEGGIGSQVVISGKSLQAVTAARLGDKECEIVQRLSNTCMTIKVPNEATSGKITLTNAEGEGMSENEFSVKYYAPEVLASSVAIDVEMGNKMLVSGKNMNVVSAVLFTAAHGQVSHPATIVSQKENEMVFTVPYVEEDEALITFQYYDGTTTCETAKDLLPVIQVKRFQPVVKTSAFAASSVGDEVTLEGEYLNKINKVYVGGEECIISTQTDTNLKFVVPNSDNFVDGHNITTLKITYFEGVESRVITDHFDVNVPFVFVWKDKMVYGQGRDVETLASFFSPETGIVYANSVWRTAVDPVSYKYQGKTCKGKNQPNVTAEEYNSVKPYFFFSGTSAGALQINTPAGSNSQLRNFYMINNSADEYRVNGIKGDCYGTPCLSFVYLNPTNAIHKAIIDKIATGTLEKIDEQTFPIDVEGRTIAGIGSDNVKQSLSNSVFAPGVFAVGAEKSADIDAYIMVIYYNVNGQGTNPTENVKRLGFLHIKHIDFKLYNNTKAPSSSSVKFDMYWMKHDYDYTK